MFTRKKAQEGIPKIRKNTSARVQPGADAQFSGAGPYTASHETSQSSAVVDRQQDYSNNPGRSDMGSTGERYGYNAYGHQHQENKSSSFNHGRSNSGSVGAERWQRDHPSDYRGTDGNYSRGFDRPEEQRQGYPLGSDYNRHEGQRQGYSLGSEYGANIERENVGRAHQAGYNPYLDSQKGRNTSHMDSDKRGDYSHVDIHRGSDDYSRMDVRRGSDYSHMDVRRGSDYSHMNVRRESDSSHTDVRRGSDYPHMDVRRGSDYPHLNPQGGGSTNFMNSQRGQSTSHMDFQREESASRRDSGRGGDYSLMDVARGSDYPALNSRGGHTNFMDSQMGEIASRMDSHRDRNTSRMDLQRGRDYPYMDVQRDRSTSRMDSMRGGDYSYMDLGRGSAYPHTNSQDGGSTSFMGSQRGRLSSRTDSERGRDYSYVDVQRDRSTSHMDSMRGGDYLYKDAQRGSDYLHNSQGDGGTSFMESQRGRHTSRADSERGGDYSYRVSQRGYSSSSMDLPRGGNPSFMNKRDPSYAFVDHEKSKDSTFERQLASNSSTFDYEFKQRSYSDHREDNDFPLAEQVREALHPDQRKDVDTHFMNQLKDKLRADPATKELLAVNNKGLALNILQKVLEVHSSITKDRPASSQGDIDYPQRSEYSHDKAPHYNEGVVRGGYLSSQESSRADRRGIENPNRWEQRESSYKKSSTRQTSYSHDIEPHYSKSNEVVGYLSPQEKTKGDRHYDKHPRKSEEWTLSSNTSPVSSSRRTSILQRLASKPYESADLNKDRTVEAYVTKRRRRIRNKQKIIRDVYGIRDNHGEIDEVQSSKASVLDRLGPRISSPPAKRRRKGDTQLSAQEEAMIGKFNQDTTYQNVRGVLRCHLCIETRQDATNYLKHFNSRKHRTRKELHESKINATISYLRDDVQLAYLRSTRNFQLAYPKNARKARIYNKKCHICHIPTSIEGNDHLALRQCWVLHVYQEPRCLCTNKVFANRSEYDDHLLSLKHLLAEQKHNTKLDNQLDEFKKNLEITLKTGKNCGRLGAFGRVARETNQFGSMPVPKEFVDHWSLFTARRQHQLPLKSWSNIYKHQLSFYDPTKPEGFSLINITTEFKCSACLTVMGVTKESVIKHCSTKEHYDNIVKKQQKSRESLTKSEKGKKLAPRDTAIRKDVKGEDSKKVAKEEDVEETVSEVDIYEDPYADDVWLDVIDEALEDDEMDEMTETIAKEEETKQPQKSDKADSQRDDKIAVVEEVNHKIDDIKEEEANKETIKITDLKGSITSVHGNQAEDIEISKVSGKELIEENKVSPKAANVKKVFAYKQGNQTSHPPSKDIKETKIVVKKDITPSVVVPNKRKIVRSRIKVNDVSLVNTTEVSHALIVAGETNEVNAASEMKADHAGSSEELSLLAGEENLIAEEKSNAEQSAAVSEVVTAATSSVNTTEVVQELIVPRETNEVNAASELKSAHAGSSEEVTLLAGEENSVSEEKSNAEQSADSEVMTAATLPVKAEVSLANDGQLANTSALVSEEKLDEDEKDSLDVNLEKKVEKEAKPKIVLRRKRARYSF